MIFLNLIVDIRVLNLLAIFSGNFFVNFFMAHLMTLVDIATMLAVLRQHVTVRTLANKAADRVAASAISAQKRHDSTFINIWNQFVKRSKYVQINILLIEKQ